MNFSSLLILVVKSRRGAGEERFEYRAAKDHERKASEEQYLESNYYSTLFMECHEVFSISHHIGTLVPK